MKKYKICVYAICKNEEKFVNKWVESMKEADDIYVLDTGSTDNTVELLKQNKVNVITKIIEPWRFDVARNESLKLVPNDTDICVCTDLDEVFEKGWRKNLEEVWNKNINCLMYNYNWSLDKNNKPLVNFYIEKMHTRNDYIWVNPVHEILKYIGNDQKKSITTNKITLNHYPDSSKPRSSYLPLLELAVKEDPKNDRNMHYLGREYMYYKKYNESIDTLIKHLKLKNAVWKDERCASMRFIARCYKALNRIEESRMWLNKAIDEAPYLRDPYVEMALLEYQEENWDKVIYYALEALKIKTHQKTYINEVFSWDNTIYDLLSIAYFNISNYKESLKYLNIAIDMDKNNKRLLENKKIIENYIKIIDK